MNGLHIAVEALGSVIQAQREQIAELQKETETIRQLNADLQVKLMELAEEGKNVTP